MDNPNHADFSLVSWTDDSKRTWPSGFKYSNGAAHRLAKQMRPENATNGLRANCVVNVYLKAKK